MATGNSPDTGMSTTGIIFTSLAAVVTVLALILATIYFAGYADDVAEWWAKRYYKAKAVAEVKFSKTLAVTRSRECSRVSVFTA